MLNEKAPHRQRLIMSGNYQDIRLNRPRCVANSEPLNKIPILWVNQQANVKILDHLKHSQVPEPYTTLHQILNGDRSSARAPIVLVSLMRFSVVYHLTSYGLNIYLRIRPRFLIARSLCEPHLRL